MTAEFAPFCDVTDFRKRLSNAESRCLFPIGNCLFSSLK